MLSWIKKKGYEGKDPKHCTYKMVTITLSSFTVVQLRGSGKILSLVFETKLICGVHIRIKLQKPS